MYKQRKHLIGKRFGKLLVISKAEDYIILSKNGKIKKASQYLCKCDCGREKIIRVSSLRAQYTKSCGCASYKERYFDDPTRSRKNAIYRTYVKNAKLRNLSFELSYDQVIDLTQKNCHYCGSEPKLHRTIERLRSNIPYNGIDRIDNKKGYSIENVVPCCDSCNYLKGSRFNNDLFLEQIFKIANYQNKKQQGIQETPPMLPQQ